MRKLEKKSIHDIFTLTPLQEGMLFHYLKEPVSDHYCEQLVLTAAGEIHPKLFKKAWGHVVQSNAGLRTFFRWEKMENPAQLILKEHHPEVHFFDLSTFNDDAEKLGHFEKITKEDRQRKFDLGQVPFRVILCKVSDCDYRVVISNHHILYDGWSTGIILKEFFQAYAVLAAGEPGPVTEAKPSFAEYIRWYQNQDRAKQKKFWEDYLQGFTAQTPLPGKRNGLLPDTGSTAAKEFPLVLGKAVKERLDGFLRERRITLAAFFYSAWGILLQKYCGCDDVVFGTTAAGRSAPINGIEHMVGLFINTIPLRMTTEPGEKINDLVERVNHSLHVREKFEYTSLIDIKGYSELPNSQELFDSIVVVENYPLDRRLMEENNRLPLVVKSYSIIEATPYPLTVSITTGEIIEIRFIFNSLSVEEIVVSRLVSHYNEALTSIIENFEDDLPCIELLSGEEKQRILMDFNNTGAEYPGDKTLHRLFAEQVERTPDTVALVGPKLQNTNHKQGGALRADVNSTSEIQLSYTLLNEESDGLGYKLIEKGVGPDTIVAVMVERSLEMVIGFLGILKAGGAYLPLDIDYPRTRIKYMLEDANAYILLAQSSFIGKNNNLKDQIPGRIIALEELPAPDEKSPVIKNLYRPTDLAYIMYTSGSTGSPKGVLVAHRNVIRLVMNTNYIELTRRTRILQTGAPVFDATTFEVWGPLLNGGQLVLVNNSVILDSHRLDKALEKFKINTLWLTSPLFNQLASENFLLFSNLDYLLVGGDALVPGFINRVRRNNPLLKIINGYGPTENTTFSTTYLIEKDFAEAIPIGRPISNSTAYILDQRRNLQPVGITGELWVGGAGVSRGYLNRVELTAEKFIKPNFPGSNKDYRPVNRSNRSYMSYLKLYKTGDLARWREDGNIEFLGRMDYQVKIRGFRIELGEIENQLLKNQVIKEVVVTAWDDKDNEKYLCAYIVLHSGNGFGAPPEMAETLKSYLLQVLPGYMVPSFFVFLEQIPLTSNGKVDRKVLTVPVNAISGKIEGTYAAPRNSLEKKLVDIWSQVLGIGQDTIGIDDNFFTIGGHSLKAVRLLGHIYKKLDAEIPLTGLFEAPTVRGLARCISGLGKNHLSPIEPTEEKEYYELAPFQKRFLVFWQFKPDDISYNIPEIMAAEGLLPREKFAGIFRQLIRRHESLRTSFRMHDGEPIRQVHADVEFEVEYRDFEKDCSQQDAASSCIRGFIRPFDLSRAPLLRLGLVKISAQTHYIMFDLHHIVSDGVSIGIFIKDFLALYSGEELPPLKIQYKDFVDWRKKRSIKTAAAKTGIHFQETVLNLPLDFPRPLITDFKGKTIKFEIGELEHTLKLLARQEDVTLYMILLSAFNVFLARITGQENIVVGSPIAGRQHPDLEGLIGLFINPLVMQNFPQGNKSFSAFLEEVKANALAAYENQDYQYEYLVEHIAAARNTGHNPLYDVMFVLQNMEMPEIEVPGLKIMREVGKNPGAKFDMTLYYEEFNSVFKLEYSTALFKEETIRRFIRYFEKILEQIAANPRQTIADIEIIPAEERQQILYDFNNTSEEYPREKCIYQLFADQVQKTPGDTAVIHSRAEDETGEINSDIPLTYRELSEKSRRWAYTLRNRGVKANTVVGIMMRRSLEMVIGILGILKAGGAYLPIDPEYPASRINNMLANSGATLLLTNSAIPSSSLGVDTLIMDRDEQWEETSAGEIEPLSGPHDLIYIIFTSGSTGIPKGAGVYHRGFVNLLHWFVTEFGLKAQDRNLLLTSMSFDLTQKNFYAPLITGGCLCIPGIRYFDPRMLLERVREYGITWLNCTPSMFGKMVERENLSQEKRLSSLRYVFLGGEPISMPALIDWLESGACKAEIVNTYGPTECTDISNFYRVKEPRRYLQEGVPLGKPINNVHLYVIDRNVQLLPLGIPGELCIGGDSVGSGYVNDKSLTARKFIRHSFETGQPKQRLYRTGDLVKWQPDGNIQFLGRLDHQVKIRGFRIELGEIENQLLKNQQVKEAVVTAREDKDNEKYLCAYIVPGSANNIDSSLDMSEMLKSYLLQVLPDYMVPSFFVLLDKIPITANGKVDRSALPEPALERGRRYTAPRNRIEQILAEIWTRLLNLRPGTVGIDDNFFHLGGHSLKATILVNRIHKEFDVNIPLAEIFKIPTIRSLASYIERREKDFFTSIEPGEKKEYYPLSSAQGRLYILWQMDINSTAYNIPAVLSLTGSLERNHLQEVFLKLIGRHESLRTSFALVAGEPVQKIHDKVEFAIEYYSLAIEGTENKEAANYQIKNFLRPFDLGYAPLLRIGLIEVEDRQRMLIVDMHHIISDGTAIRLLLEEFTALMAGKNLPGLKLQYKEYAWWQTRSARQEILERQKNYWEKQLEGEIPVLELPRDFCRPEVQRFEGHHLMFELGQEETTALNLLTQESGATLFMVLLAVYYIFLSKLTNQDDILVGIPVMGRQHADLVKIMGMFVNTLVLRNFPLGEKSFNEFLKELKEVSLEAFENQDYQYEDLVEALQVPRDTSRNPLFDTMFVMQNVGLNTQPLEIPGFKVEFDEFSNLTSKFDLTFIVSELVTDIAITVEYSTDLFKEATIRRFILYFKKVVSTVIGNPGLKIAEIEILGEMEKKQLLFDFNATEAEYPRNRTIHDIFSRQVKKTPDHAALIGPKLQNTNHELQTNYKSQIINYKTQQDTARTDTEPDYVIITYNELNVKSHQLAQRLILQGVLPDSIVGIMIEPSLEMIIGILAILKAGGGYLPLDPQQPAERITYMLNDSQAPVLLTSHSLAQILAPGNDYGQNRIYLDDASVYTGERTDPAITDRSQDVIYTIYTSGTTGKSKGTLIENKNLVNYIHWFKKKVHLTGRDRTVLTSSFAFDLGYTILYSALLWGCPLHIVPRENYLSPEKFLDYIQQQRVTYIKLTPSLFRTLVNSSKFSQGTCKFLRLILLGGEAIKLYDVEKAHTAVPHLEIMNHYGPTEATIGCVARFIDFSQWNGYMKNPTIGSPIDNMKAIILDRGLNLVPVGTPGELCVSGAGVARGYLNQPELTAEKFCLRWPGGSFTRGTGNSPHSPHSTDLTDLTYSTNSTIYRTGDLARWIEEGAIEFLGRIDKQVKIRGYRIETGEIQEILLLHKTVKDVVVIPYSHPSSDKYLCAYIVADSDETIELATLQTQLKEYLVDKLPDYMIPSYFLTMDRIPLTPNGKLNRKLLPEPGKKIETSGITPRDAAERKLAEIWADVLPPNNKSRSIGIDENFFLGGGNSLTAIILISRIHKEFSINISLGEIFKTPTIRGLSRYIKTRAIEYFASIEPVEEKNHYMLSSAQKRLFILQQMDAHSTGYNMPVAIELKGEILRDKLRDVFSRLICRHESLRTSFHIINDIPVQIIHKEAKLEIEEYNFDHRQEATGISNRDTRGETYLLKPNRQELRVKNYIHDFIRPFDLAHAPLLRVGLLKTGNHLQILVVDMHHIIGDGISRRLMLEEFTALMAGEVLPALKLRYKDYAQWQNRQTNRDTLKWQKSYWEKQMEGEIPVLDLPTDFMRPGVQKFEGKHTGFELDQEVTDALKTLAQESGATLYMVLLAVYYIFLSKLTNQEDILVGTPTMGRRHAELEKIMGMFVNTLVLRNYPLGEKSYNEFLKELKELSLQAFENQDYQYEDLVEELKVSRDTSRNPLFDTMFVMQNLGLDIQPLAIPGLQLEFAEFANLTSKFDLTLIVSEPADNIQITVEYSTILFTEATIKRFIIYFNNVVSTVLGNPSVKISGIEILGEEEKQQILYDFNATETEYPRNRTIHDLFSRQVKKTPDHTALIGPKLQYKNHQLQTNDKSQITNYKLRPGTAQPDTEPAYMTITYNELNVKSDGLAHLLIEKGVQPDTIVGIMLERSMEMIIGLLGILKAGGTYLPIDPELPKDRIDYMVKDSGAKLLITTNNKEGEKVRRWEGEKVLMDEIPRSLKSAAHLLTFLPSHLQNSSNLTHPFTLLPSYLQNSSNQAGRRSPAQSLAYVIYTSGSTGKPKGVLIEHTSVVNRLNWMQRCYPIGEGDVILHKTPFTFDVSVWELFWWGMTGAMVYLLAAGEEKNPETILRAIENNKITTIHFVPSMLNAFFDYIENEVDLKKLISLRQVFASGEALGAYQVERFNRQLNKTIGTKLMNLYGPTEATVDVTYFNCLPGESRKTIPIGRPIDNTRLLIIDKNGSLQPIGIPGELSIAGICLGRGYLNRPELTAEKFKRVVTNDRLYHTGDLARWKWDGNVEFLGRMDFQVKVRGFRIELEEIEKQLLTHDQIKEAVVTAKHDNSGDTYLAAYIVPSIGGHISIPGVRDYLVTVLPVYMVPAYFIPMDELPLTSNGKIDRRKLPDPQTKREANSHAPQDEIEQKLVAIWMDILSLQTPIGIDDNFFTSGGHSLKAILVAARIHKILSVKLSLNEIFKYPTIRQLAGCIKCAAQEQYTSINPVEAKEFYLLSPGQKRLYLLQQMDESGTAYNMPWAAILAGQIDQERLENSFKRLIRRHESLRTSFHLLKEEPVQRIYDEVEFQLENYNDSTTKSTEDTEGKNYKIQNTNDKKVDRGQCSVASEKKATSEIGSSYRQPVTGNRQPSALSPDTNTIINDFIRPFDLSKAPLLRVGLIEITGGGTNTVTGNRNRHALLLIDMHHIISDGISTEILVQDFASLYSGKELLAINIQYKDFSEWQNREKEREHLHEQGAYWKKEYNGEIPVLGLPTDYSRSTFQVFAGANIGFELSSPETLALRAVASRHDVTLYMVLLTFYAVLLSRLANQEDIVIGTPMAGRRHADLGKIIGMFVNTLALRIHPLGEMRFCDFLSEVKRKTLEAFENQDYPYEDLVNLVSVTRDASRNPLFDTMFALQNIDNKGIDIPGLMLSPYEYEHKTSKFDLTLLAVEAGDKLLFMFEYSTKLFKEVTIARFIGYFKKMISCVLSESSGDVTLSAIEIIPAEEKRQLLYDFNETAAEYPKDKTLHRLFAEQVERTPDYTALVGPQLQPIPLSQIVYEKNPSPMLEQETESGYITITYSELKVKSAKLAHRLIQQGVAPDTIVGIMIERSVEMIIGILGILKAGGAYLPIDPEYPAERIDYMLRDSEAKLLITGNTEGEKVRRWEGEKILPEEIFKSHKSSTPLQNSSNLIHPLTFLPSHLQNSSNLAYVIYTSGSTGKPKGVLIQHRSVVNMVRFHWEIFGENANSRISQVASASFDAMVFEIWPGLLAGAAHCIVDNETRMDPRQLMQWLITHHITISFQPTQMAERLLEEEWPTTGIALEVLRTGGDKLTVYPMVSYPFRFYNLYGPTEDTIWTTWAEVPITPAQGTKSPPIGKPAANKQVYILNRSLTLQPLGIAGELCISGEGLARGYLNQPELTADKFCLWQPGNCFREDLSRHPAPRGLDRRKNFLLLPSHSPHSPSPTYSTYSTIYKTGDSARWLLDGNIEFLGRIDHQVKIRGYRIETGEIEMQLKAHENIKEAVVLVSANKSGEKYLCAYIVSPSPALPGIFDPGDLRLWLLKTLPDYMIPSHFVPLEAIPLNASGKVDRKALPIPGNAAAAAVYSPPRDKIEAALVRLWAEILGNDAQHSLQLQETIGLDDHFFHLGGHSLKAAILLSRIHKELGAKMPLSEIFRKPTVRLLGESVRASETKPYSAIEPVEKKEYYDLSNAQHRLWVLDQIDKENSAYNMPGSFEFSALNEKAFAMAVETLVKHHESLRTTFITVEGKPKQKIHDYETLDFNIHYIDLRNRENQEETAKIIKEKEIETPFNLEKGPLLRIHLLCIEDNRYLILFTIHHIVSDGWSMMLLENQFISLYNAYCREQGSPLPLLRIQYKDFAAWHNLLAAGQTLEKHREYWTRKFREEIPVLELKTDSPRPLTRTFRGGRVPFDMESETRDGLIKRCRENNTSMLMLLAALLKTLLYRYTDQEDIVIGLPVAGREQAELQNQVGFYINILPLRTSFSGKEESFEKLLARVKQTLLDAYEHQEYPFDRLVADLELERNTGRFPLFDVVLQYLSFEGIAGASTQNVSTTGMEGVSINRVNLDINSSKFDLTWNFAENQAALSGMIIYNADLFEHETIIIMMEKFKLLAREIIALPGRCPADFEINLELEKKLKESSDPSDFSFDFEP